MQQHRNFKADAFRSVGASHLRRDIVLQDGREVSLIVLGHFLSVLEASPGRFIDFDNELEIAIEKIGDGELPVGLDLVYIDHVGFDDPSGYGLNRAS